MYSTAPGERKHMNLVDQITDLDERRRTPYPRRMTMRMVAAADGWVTIEVEPDLVVHIKRGIGPKGEYICAGLLVEGEIDSTTLQRIRPARLLSQAAPLLKLVEIADDFGDDRSTTLESLRTRVPKAVRNPQRRKLGRPDGTADFYQRVAVAYTSASAESDTPAMVLAEENDVPPDTIRRWIKEARRRGLLAPGRKGRAG